MSRHHVTIALNPIDLDQLRQLAGQRGQTVADYVARLIASDLAQACAPLTPGAALQRASLVVR